MVDLAELLRIPSLMPQYQQRTAYYVNQALMQHIFNTCKVDEKNYTPLLFSFYAANLFKLAPVFFTAIKINCK